MPFKNEICSCFCIGSLDHNGKMCLISPYRMYFEVLVWLQIALSWEHQQEPLCFCAINSHQFSLHFCPPEYVPVILSYVFRWGFVPGMSPRAVCVPALAEHLSAFSCSSGVTHAAHVVVHVPASTWLKPWAFPKVIAQVKEIIQSCYFLLSWHSGFVHGGIMKWFSFFFFFIFAWFTSCAYLFPLAHGVSSPHTLSFSWLKLSNTQPR